MALSSWQETKIYKALIKRTGSFANSIVNLLENPKVMKKIEAIIDKGGTTPKDFTLHDAMHSFRVAEMMWELIPEETRSNLSDYELGLLLLAAYLHDIGMSPNFSKVENHFLYLTEKKKDSLTNSEKEEFQKWIDNNIKGDPIDISKDSIDNFKKVNYILTYYIRHKHNDWSGDWIEENLNDFALENYTDWRNDLIKICKSHHYGLEKLIDKDFDPKPIKNITVHLRYLAICLRIADVMENDPERTPEVILKHRDIAASSVKYWLRDHQFQFRRDGNKFTLYARPKRAYIYKAIEETAELIENELKLCNRLIIEKPLNYSSFGNLITYKWISEAYVVTDIEPFNDSFEYIEGSFRPNTGKILDILGGTQLYGDPKWAVRELIQNSFDAVKEKIAYEIIKNAKEPHILSAKLGELNEIFLRLEKKDDGYWLVCKDTGVGMTRDIIEKSFLISGSLKPHEIIELERRCKEMGFNLGRTGQFGIGVLSYFMIAEKLIVKTKRTQDTGYPDDSSQSLVFEIDGIYDFGELAKTNPLSSGTEISLKLREELCEQIEHWDEKISSLVSDNIAKSPCKIVYESCLTNHNNESISTGWKKSIDSLKGILLYKFLRDDTNSEKEEMLTLERKSEKEFIKKTIYEAYERISKTVDFLIKEGELPDKSGSFRITIPYFNLKHGASLYYLHESDNNDEILALDGKLFWRPDFYQYFLSLKGIDIEQSFADEDLEYLIESNHRNAFIEIDLESIKDSSLSVSRHTIILNESFKDIRNFIDRIFNEMISEFEYQFDNNYDSFNSRFTGKKIENDFWVCGYYVKSSSANQVLKVKYSWEKILYPFIDARDYKNERFQYNNSPLKSILSDIDCRGVDLEFSRITDYCKKFRLGIYRVKGYKGIKYNLTRVATNDEANKQVMTSFFSTIELPDILSDITFFTESDYSFQQTMTSINLKSEFIPFLQLAHDYYKSLDENLFKENLFTKNKPECFAMLIYLLTRYKDGEEWKALYENKGNEIAYIFKTLETKEITILSSYYTITKLSISERKVTRHKETQQLYPFEEINESYFIRKK